MQSEGDKSGYFSTQRCQSSKLNTEREPHHGPKRRRPIEKKSAIRREAKKLTARKNSVIDENESKDVLASSRGQNGKTGKRVENEG